MKIRIASFIILISLLITGCESKNTTNTKDDNTEFKISEENDISKIDIEQKENDSNFPDETNSYEIIENNEVELKNIRFPYFGHSQVHNYAYYLNQEISKLKELIHSERNIEEEFETVERVGASSILFNNEKLDSVRTDVLNESIDSQKEAYKNEIITLFNSEKSVGEKIIELSEKLILLFEQSNEILPDIGHSDEELHNLASDVNSKNTKLQLWKILGENENEINDLFYEYLEEMLSYKSNYILRLDTMNYSNEDKEKIIIDYASRLQSIIDGNYTNDEKYDLIRKEVIDLGYLEL